MEGWIENKVFATLIAPPDVYLRTTDKLRGICNVGKYIYITKMKNTQKHFIKNEKISKINMRKLKKIKIIICFNSAPWQCFTKSAVPEGGMKRQTQRPLSLQV